MKYLVLTVTSSLLASILVSCDNSGVVPALSSQKKCDVHKIECLEEEIEILAAHVSYSESYWEFRKSEEYIQAVNLLFPNANSGLLSNPYGERGKKFRRFYCPHCREQETKWFANKNKNEAEQAAPSNR